MKKVLITGSEGFIGKNLLVNIRFLEGFEPLQFDLKDDLTYLKSILKEVDFVFHLAGVNRPENEQDFITGNTDFTRFIADTLTSFNNFVPLVLTSSIQAELENPYGQSKLKAEKIVEEYTRAGGKGYIYRLPNVFGKWCRPDYNSVVATFCHNIANGYEIKVTDRSKVLELVHVDDIIEDFIEILTGSIEYFPERKLSVTPSYKVSLGEIADLVRSFSTISSEGVIPDLANDFVRKLHSTYLSYVPPGDAVTHLEKMSDDRGYIFELIRSKAFGQIFVSKTKPGITRGNHFHNQKNEKFCVVEGEAIIRVRHLITNDIYEYKVDGSTPVVVDILPGYTHSITNCGKNELITLFWANEPFNKEKPDTYFEKV